LRQGQNTVAKRFSSGHVFQFPFEAILSGNFFALPISCESKPGLVSVFSKKRQLITFRQMSGPAHFQGNVFFLTIGAGHPQ
jgi:hypothetical protein